MARRKPKTNVDEALPEYITNAPLLKKKVVSRAGLSKFIEQMMLLHAPAASQAFWSSLIFGCRHGEPAAMRLCAEIYGYVQKPGGINIFNNLQATAVSSNGGGFSFDKIMRDLAASRAEAAPVIDVNPDSNPALEA